MENEVERSLSAVSQRTVGEAKDAVSWFGDKLKTLRDWTTANRNNAQPREFPTNLQGTVLTKGMGTRGVGRMVMFGYDAKHKDRLPYWDALPLIFLVDYKEDGFTGLNLHYVPPMVRKTIIDALLPNLNVDPVTTYRLTRQEKKNITLSYQTLQALTRYDVLKPCFKRYLYSQVRTGFMFIDPTEWQKAVMLPTERFQKAPKGRVFKESMAQSSGAASKPNLPTKPTSNNPLRPTSQRTTDFFSPPGDDKK